MLTTYEQRSKLKLAATVLTIVVVAGIILLLDHLKSHQPATMATAQTATSNTMTTPSVTSAPASSTATGSSTATTATSSYKDGTYTATADYYVPHGQEDIKVSLTLQNGTVTNASVVNSENDFDSAQYQEEFTAEYKNAVVGKKIDGLRLSIIAGASDTTQGFNDAVSKISSQAKA